ncbi:MAG: Na+ dependent nucleoside transporter domain-containing protein [Ignavibacteria bacterium RIFOXYB2_FULL_35_12]|nr:MAG: Na+ dependent nucleoside transporter domain-containing protein [Ignavibacteria bacterium GWF2_35_20]OGU78008.1 MAG: Na+ dependent nucleoside transporter domain-containing protein [Ignavibacteria bacterium RIFOXYA2_FULL_35_9]OGU87110.1 MAG: Na+ dependent nucleoside transporter domain-containing protein [Ignavibacteria bacterium RIFOXYA12_FULL_35_25]OGU92425.1 MAG: Na+ dependent nucleoside transporter domain-containing protein [Ignavibacteria bacterium RIFOXYC12_FULL_35_11]OGU95802.1 MAG:
MEFIFSLLRGVLGLLILLGIAFLFSNNKRRVNWRLVATGVTMQIIFAIFIIHSESLRGWFFPLGWPKDIINWLGAAIVSLLGFTIQGAQFVFGKLAINSGPESLGFYFAFQVLPTIIFVSCLTSVLYYLGILQLVVKGMAWVMSKLLGTSGAESLSNAANIFVGQTEAPLLIRPYIKTMTNSEILTIMVGGMATIAGGVMASYIQMLGQSFAEAKGIGISEAQVKFAVQLLAASAMAAPAALVISKILFPEVEEPITKGSVKLKVEKNASNVIEAAATGASDGLQLALNVAGMLLAFIALIALVNYLLTGIGDLLNLNAYLQSTFGKPLSMQLIFGLILQYLAYGIGVPWADSFHFGSLIGTKVVLNEFVAYLDLAALVKSGAMSEKGIMMATYALCGFANFASIAIQIGGISPMAPERKKDISALGLKAVLGGTIATLMTATLAGLLV